MELRKLSLADTESVKNLVFAAFSEPPWNDDWSDSAQFHQYIVDLTQNANSLTLGLYSADANERDACLVAVSMGRIIHWFEGTEYFIDDLCVRPDLQGQGIGSLFMSKIEDYLRRIDVKAIVLRSEREIPAYFFYCKLGFVENAKSVFFTKTLF